MNAEAIYAKTEKGKGEVGNRSDALSMEARRVLILVNGQTPIAEIQRKALVEDIEAMLQQLESGGYIRSVEEAEDLTIRDPELTINIAEAREFMANTLLTFGDQLQVMDLIEQIRNVQDANALRDRVAPWYQALSDTPDGVHQADHLKEDLLRMLESPA
jgi:hypothetical protein